jgi:hypothetical protein
MASLDPKVAGRGAMRAQELAHQLQRRMFVSDEHIKGFALSVDGSPKVGHLAVDSQIEVSGAGGIWPRALSEPEVILSHHPTPIVRPLLMTDGPIRAFQ